MKIPNGTRGSRGFTLIEVMITLTVLAVLATVAYTSYQSSVVKSRRAAATVCLLEAAQFMEREYTTRMTYANVNALPPQACRTDLAAFYTFQLNGVPQATTYSIEAIPQGLQAAADGKCGTLRMNQAGTRSITGTGGTVDTCW